VVGVAVQAEQAQRAGDLRPGARGGGFVEVGLVDDHQVGQFHHALLDGLQVVARVGQLQQHEQSVMPATAVSLWPTPTVSTITTS
jgi:hypothetical protein